MKKFFIITLGLLPLTMLAQVDRTKAPQPSAAPQIKIGQPATFTLTNGLKVFVVENNKLPRVSATLSFNQDGIVEGDKAGLTSIAGQLLRRGTTTLSKEKLDEEVDFLGGNINTSAFSASASSLKANFPRLMALMADVAFRPALPATELEKIRKQSLSGLQAQKDNPNAIAANVVNRVMYGKAHPYGDIETEETISNVKLADVKTFFNTYWKPNNAFLVFVGDITPADAKALATKHFGAWKSGAVPKPVYKTPQSPAATYIAVVDRPASVQSIITIAAPVELKPGAPDVIKSSVMSNILGGGFSGRLFANLREKYGFTYGAYSNLSNDRLIGNFKADASVRNEKTDSSIGQFMYEFNRIRTEPTPADEVSRMKNYLSGSFARSLENPATIAGFALNIAKYNLPANYYQNYLTNLAAVSPADVQAMATKYVMPGRMHIVIVGNAKEITKGLEKYGPVRYFNVYGQEIPPPAAKTVDASVTPQSVLQKAIEAYGGAAVVSAVKDLSMKGTATIQGMTITVTQKHIVPTAFVQEVSMQGMTVQKQILKDGVVSMSSMQGGDKKPDDQDKEELMEDAAIAAEVIMLKNSGYTFTMKGIESVEGKDAYAIAIKSPAGRETTRYYDVANGLLVKLMSMEDGGPQGKVPITTLYGDYKAFGGLKIPTKITNDLGGMKFDIVFDDVKVNTGLKPGDIK